MTMISTSNVMQVKVAEHQVQHKCPCLACRQDRVRAWVGKLLDAGIPAENIMMEINQYGGRVIIYSGNKDKDCHHLHKEKWCYQFNDRSFDFAMIWWKAHGRKPEPTAKEKILLLKKEIEELQREIV